MSAEAQIYRSATQKEFFDRAFFRQHYHYGKDSNKLKTFNGNGNVKKFLTKVELHSSLKGYSGEKCAQDLASRLEGRAFDIYMRLSDQDKKDVSEIKAELLKEFEHRQKDREETLNELSHCTV